MKVKLKIFVSLVVIGIVMGCSNNQIVGDSSINADSSRTITLPSTPYDLKEVIKRPTTLDLKWGHVESAVTYKIYYRSAIADTKKITVIESESNYYSIKGLPSGDIIDFWVTAIDYSGAESDSSKVLRVTMDCKLKKPSGLKEIGFDDVSIKLKWDVNGDPVGKHIVHLNSVNGNITQEVYTNYVKIYDLEPNTEYYIYIESCSGEIYRSDYSDGIVVKTAKPTYDEWNQDKVYVNGDIVQYQGEVFEAKWWNLNQNPNNEPYGPWKLKDF